MAMGLATATLVGVVLGWGKRISAVILVLPLLIIGGMVSGLSIIQIGSSVLVLQVGYIVSSFLRISRTKGQGRSDATRTINAAGLTFNPHPRDVVASSFGDGPIVGSDCRGAITQILEDGGP